jgi:hypothetical protein
MPTCRSLMETPIRVSGRTGTVLLIHFGPPKARAPQTPTRHRHHARFGVVRAPHLARAPQVPRALRPSPRATACATQSPTRASALSARHSLRATACTRATDSLRPATDAGHTHVTSPATPNPPLPPQRHVITPREARRTPATSSSPATPIYISWFIGGPIKYYNRRIWEFCTATL